MLTRCLGFLALPWQHHDYMQVKPKIAFVDIGLSFLSFFFTKVYDPYILLHSINNLA